MRFKTQTIMNKKNLKDKNFNSEKNDFKVNLSVLNENICSLDRWTTPKNPRQDSL